MFTIVFSKITTFCNAEFPVFISNIFGKFVGERDYRIGAFKWKSSFRRLEGEDKIQAQKKAIKKRIEKSYVSIIKNTGYWVLETILSGGLLFFLHKNYFGSIAYETFFGGENSFQFHQNLFIVSSVISGFYHGREIITDIYTINCTKKYARENNLDK